MIIPQEYSFRLEFVEPMRIFLDDSPVQPVLQNLAEQRLKRRDIVLSATYKGMDPHDHDYVDSIWLDGAFAFGMHLSGEESPAAVYSFNRIGNYDRGGLDIVQIQAPQRLQGEPLTGRWEKFGVGLVEEYAKWRGDIATVTIRPVEQNNWFWKVHEAKYQRGRLRYDVTAKRAGYQFDPNLERFIKYL
ncbi:hypothetical protein HYW44_04465 [Candidatus Daviesbacteria bacterium]|nr:hypothetical protein [Candidatus Daviesbacteria bacterium]